ncbi:hypothetical protein BGZ63DRAFT_378749 [Mariannaea sp. PMI_226]|nr:hypothetical protein BGZ63DRAFT_378749 [Mariannaea sp. PMI_226]
MSSISDVTFCATVLLSSFITMLCSSPPGAAPKQEWKKDRLGAYASPRAASVRRGVAVGLGIYHGALVLTNLSASPICPAPGNLNTNLFSWNAYTAACLFSIICVGGPLRLTAFAGLGQNFTFRLGPPDRLITGGIYQYIQHPSYTGQMLVLVANLALFIRWDGPLSCWIPASVSGLLDGWGLLLSSILVFGMFRKLVHRVKDEEVMLKETFGAEWVKWNQSTKRFIPWVV